MAVWAAAWEPFVVACLLLLVPGICVAWAAGLRSLGGVALAPLLSIAVLSVSAVAAPFVGLQWGLVAAVVGTVLTAAVTLIVRMAIARKRGWRTGQIRWGYPVTLMAVLGLAAGFGILLRRLTRIFGDPAFVSQTADNVFHLNAVRFIIETGSASSLTLGAAGGSEPGFYPGAWHGLAALIVELSGAQIPAAVACLNLVIGALVWPLSMWFFCRTLLGGSVAMNVGFGVLISLFSAFPYLLVDWGVIYPNYLGLAATPAVAGIAVMLCRNSFPASRQGAMLPWLGLMGLAGIALSHPNSVICLIVIVVPYLLARVLRGPVIASLLHGTRERRASRILGGAVLAAGIGAAWWVLRPFPVTSFNTTWPPYQSSAQAVGEALLATHSGREGVWTTAALLVFGLVLAFRHRGYRWLGASFLLWTLLMVSVTAWTPSVARAFLTGGWFDDYKRIAAGLVLVAMPLALLGFMVAYRAVTGLVGRLPAAHPALGFAVAVVVVALPVAAVGHTGAIQEATDIAAKNYSLRPGSPIMSADEFQLYQELPDIVPADQVIAGNPWDGSAWAYFVSGRQVLFPHVLPAIDEDEALIAASLNTAASNPEVCAAARRLNVGYAINSDELIYLPGNPNNEAYPGLEHLDKAAGFDLVAQVGGNRLYKLAAC